MTTRPKVNLFHTARRSARRAASKAAMKAAKSAVNSAMSAREARAKPEDARMGEPGPRPDAGTDQGGAGTAETSVDEILGSSEAQSPERKAAIAAVKAEGLSARQLRLARRVAQKHGVTTDDDYEAIVELRAQGIDPFQRANIVGLVKPNDPRTDLIPSPGGTPGALPSTHLADIAERRASEVRKIQIDLARRRRRKAILLTTRLLFFVFAPTALAWHYFANVATPMYETVSEFLIQKAGPATAGGGGGLGSLLTGTSFATQQDSITVQSYLASREVLLRLDAEHGWRDHFTGEEIDPLQRLEPDASESDAFKLYKKYVQVSYDPTEGLVRLMVTATTPEASQRFSEVLIGYAEERVNQITDRVRRDQMAGAEANYAEVEAERQAALAELTRVQTTLERLDPEAEAGALMSRITALETERDRMELELASLLDNPRPNQARVDSSRADLERLNEQIRLLRSQMTEATDDSVAMTEITARLREAEENYSVRLARVTMAIEQLETAQLEADRQSLYLETSVRPIAPDEPTYPRVFEGTIVAFFVFGGLYLIIAITAAVFREQLAA